MGEPPAQPQQATWLDWIPVPALVLACDGSALAVNERWADLSPVPGEGQGWLEAAATGEPGSADGPVTGPRGGRRSRWWWHPFPPGGLVVCVAVVDDGTPEGLPVPGDVRDPLAREQTRAGLPSGIRAELAAAAVHRIFQAGLALEAAASLLPGPAATPVLGVVDDLDQLVRDIRDAVLEQQAGTRVRRPPPAEEAHSETGIPSITAATPQAAGRAGEALDSVVTGIFTAGMGA